MANKSALLRTFNDKFFEFIDSIIHVMPENEEIHLAKEIFLYFKRLNPTIIIKIWCPCIYNPYKTQIDKGDIEFFLNKNYNEDLDHLPNTKDIINIVDKIRVPIRQMNETNKIASMEFIQKLCKLSLLYEGLS